RREARIVAAFNHPNIVAGYDLGQEGGYHFFVMEFVEGKSLRELLSEWGSFPEEQVLDTAIKITSALDHAYKKGVIHRDIKPGNILVDAYNKVKLTDMGLAKGPADLTITREGATVGTPQYISPEQARDPQNADVRSDLYSLGATLFHMCTGQPPFRAETMANVILKVINDRAASAREINPEISEELSTVIRKLMAKDPDLRYQTPAELLADLHRVQRDEKPDVNLRQLEALDRVGRKPNRLALAAGGVAGVVMLVVGGVLLWNGNNNSKEPVVPDRRPQEDYREALRRDLLGAAGWPEKFDALRGREAVANSWQNGILAAARAAVERDLGGELDGFLARQDDRLRQWTLDWGEPARFFSMKLPDNLHERFGLRPAELPAGVRESYDKRVRELGERAPSYENQRDTGYLARLDQHLANLYTTQQEYRDLLQDRDFDGAQRTLSKALSDFHRDGPRRDQMSSQLRGKVSKREEAARGRELDRIAQAEKREADMLLRRADGVIAQVRELLRPAPSKSEATSPNPHRAELTLTAGRKRLTAAFPPDHFRAESSPWPAVEDKLDVVERQVELESTKYEHELLQLALRDALRIAFADGRAGDAAAYLQGRLFKVGEQELRQHIELLQQAEAARSELLGRIDRRQVSKRLKVLRRVDRRPIEVVLKRDRGRLVITTGRNDLVTLAEVALPALEELAGEDFREGLTADQRAGLALWYVLGGDYAEVSKLTEKGRRSEFLNRELKLLAEQLRREELGPQMAATRMLETAHKALRDGDWQTALETVDQIRAQHPTFHESHNVEEARIRHEANEGLSRTRKLAVLEAAAPPGAKVRMQGWRVSVDYPLATVDLPLPRGWQRSGPKEDGGVSFVQPMPTLAAATASALTVKSLLAEEDADHVTVRISLSFPEEGAAQRLVMFRCHGIGVVLALLRDGAVVARLVKVAELEDFRKMCQHLQPGLKTAADKRNTHTMYAGAKHQLKLVVVRRGRKLRGTLFLDEDPNPLIQNFDVSGPRRPAPELAVIAMHPLTVHAVRFEGEAKR
ncbi:MAG: serine/threonine-protein kinase, partial [Planctomycetota bacterium]